MDTTPASFSIMATLVSWRFVEISAARWIAATPRLWRERDVSPFVVAVRRIVNGFQLTEINTRCSCRLLSESIILKRAVSGLAFRTVQATFFGNTNSAPFQFIVECKVFFPLTKQKRTNLSQSCVFFCNFSFICLWN